MSKARWSLSRGRRSSAPVAPAINSDDLGVYAIPWVNDLGEEAWQARNPATGELLWRTNYLFGSTWETVQPENTAPMLGECAVAIATGRMAEQRTKRFAWKRDGRYDPENRTEAL